jgi:diamine N-acetyltransferase
MFTITQAQPSDAPAIQKLLRETWQVTYGDHLTPETLEEVYQKWQSIEFLTKQINNPEMFFPIAKDGDQLVGIATAHQPDDRIQLFRLYVYCTEQRQGIGSKLLEAVINHFPTAQKIQVYVEALNPTAQNFYCKHGFVEIGRENEKVVTQTIEQVLMEKKLHSS